MKGLMSVGARLLLLVQPSSARPVEPVRRDSSFAKKQESYPALLLVVEAVAQTVGALGLAGAGGSRLR
jgi:hypothetical protein